MWAFLVFGPLPRFSLVGGTNDILMVPIQVTFLNTPLPFNTSMRSLCNMFLQDFLKGNIDAELVSIAGKFDGQVLSEVVSIRSTGSVTGEVSYDNISIEEGAKVEAQLGKKKQ